MELGNVLPLIKAEEDAQDSLGMEETSQRIVGVEADVVEEGLGEKDDLERGAGHGLPHGVLPGGPLQLQLLRGLVVLVVAPLETAVRLLGRAAAHEILHDAGGDPRGGPLRVPEEVVEHFREVGDPLLGHDAVLAEDDDHIHELGIRGFRWNGREQKALPLMRMYNTSKEQTRHPSRV